MKDVYKNRYGEDITDHYVQKLYSVAVSIFAIGGMIGGFSGGIIANRFGRLVDHNLLLTSFLALFLPSLVHGTREFCTEVLATKIIIPIENCTRNSLISVSSLQNNSLNVKILSVQVVVIDAIVF